MGETSRSATAQPSCPSCVNAVRKRMAGQRELTAVRIKKTPANLENEEEVFKLMLELSQDVDHRLRVHGFAARGVQIWIKANDLGGMQCQCKLPFGTQLRSLQRVYIRKSNVRKRKSPGDLHIVRPSGLCSLQVSMFSRKREIRTPSQSERSSDFSFVVERDSLNPN